VGRAEICRFPLAFPSTQQKEILDMGEPIRIVIGGREFNIRTVKIRQAREIDVLISKPSPPASDPVALTAASWDRMLGVVQIALHDSYPDVTLDFLLDSEGNIDDVHDAYKAVLSLLGLKPVKAGEIPKAESQPGEENAGAPPA
jgi:hypothetical protein